jgi:hypothetical protein
MNGIRDESLANESRLHGKIRDNERKREQIGKRIESLNRKKEDPYRLIGRCLADEGIPPMNQPEALENVMAVRLSVQEIETQIAGSLACTAQVNRRELQLFYALAGLVILVVVICLVIR